MSEEEGNKQLTLIQVLRLELIWSFTLCSCRLWHHAALYVDTDVSEEHGTFFRVEIWILGPEISLYNATDFSSSTLQARRYRQHATPKRLYPLTFGVTTYKTTLKLILCFSWTVNCGFSIECKTWNLTIDWFLDYLTMLILLLTVFYLHAATS